MSGEPELSREDLRKQYELVLQEYRFQVLLNWDRAKHFLIFNAGLFAAAVALYKSGATAMAKVGIAVLLVLCAANSIVGRHAVGEGHRMYRAIRGTKTKLEKALRIGDYAISDRTWLHAVPVPSPTQTTGRTTAATKSRHNEHGSRNRACFQGSAPSPSPCRA